MEVVEVEGGVAIFLSEYFGDVGNFECFCEEGPLVVKSDHGFDTFFTPLLERCGGDVLGKGVRCQCIVRTDCRPLFLQWE